MTFKVVAVPISGNPEYVGLQKAGGEEQLFLEANVGSDFSNWERYYDRRQSAILDGDPILFHRRDRKDEFEGFRELLDLRTDHQFLDYGCATLGVGQHYARYLDLGHYVGMDLSKKAIDIGRAFVARADLAERRPELVLLEDGAFPDGYDDRFDRMIAISVFTHSPPQVVVNIAKFARRVLKPGGIFLATVGIVEENIIFQGRHNFYYPKEFFLTMGEHLGVDITVEPDSLPQSSDPRILGPSMNVIVRK
jgi:SAM-dependent methyltransferase